MSIGSVVPSVDGEKRHAFQRAAAQRSSNSPVPMTRPPGMVSGVLVPMSVSLLSVSCGATRKSDHSSAGLT